jgi:hypothetical protein
MNAKSQKLRKLWSTCNNLFSKVNYAQYYAGQETAFNYSPINKGTEFDILKNEQEQC